MALRLVDYTLQPQGLNQRCGGAGDRRRANMSQRDFGAKHQNDLRRLILPSASRYEI